MRYSTLFSFFLFAYSQVWSELSLQPVGPLLASPDTYDGRSVCVEGTAENIQKSVSAKKNVYFTLNVKQGPSSLKVFSFGHPAVREGQSVLVCGRFYKENKVGEYTFRNELTACLVEKLPGLFGPALHSGQRPDFSGPVIGVMDGDTLEVLALGHARRVRLEGVDCPEKRQAFGNTSTQFTSAQVLGKIVSVEVLDIDKYGRMVAWVKMKDGRLLNEEIVRAGMGWWYRKFAPENKTLERLEAEARTAQRGLWADKNQIPPWDFRHPPARSLN